MLSKSISTSKKLNRVSDQAALLFSWTLPHLDDYGNMDGSVGQLKAIVIPSRSWSASKVEKSRNELLSIGAWILYEADNEPYIHCEKFDDFQTFKGDRERLSLYPKYRLELRKSLDSTRKPMDSYKLSEVKVSQDKLSELNSSPSAGFKENYLKKFSTPKKIYSSKHLLAAEIGEWSGAKLKIPMLMRLIGLKGEEFVRRSWAEMKQENAKDPIALFMWKLGKVKIKMEPKVGKMAGVEE